MPLSNQAPATRTSLIYLTVGSIMTVWTIIWLIYYMANPPAGNMLYIIFGFMATGLVLAAIGFGVGSIGRSAKTAETQPAVVVPPPGVAQPVQPGAAPANSTVMPPVVVMESNAQPAATTFPTVARTK